MPRPRVIVVGAGPAGCFAALTCASHNPSAEIIILERDPLPLRAWDSFHQGKGLVTRDVDSPETLVDCFPRGGRELLGPFHKWGPYDIIEWFQQNGLELTWEEDGSICEKDFQGGRVRECLLSCLSSLNIQILCNANVIAADTKRNGGFWITLANEETLEADRLLFSPGGLLSTKARAILENLGHNIHFCVPSLYGFRIGGNSLKGLSRETIETVRITHPESGTTTSGTLLIHPPGISGSSVLNLSVLEAESIFGAKYTFPIDISWLGTGVGECTRSLEQSMRKLGSRKVVADCPFPIPESLWRKITAECNIPDHLAWQQLDRTRKEALARSLGATRLQVVDRLPCRDENAVAGGVVLEEVNFNTMESRLVSGLFFAGDVLDISGFAGGYNLQATWTTARLAGLALVAG